MLPLTLRLDGSKCFDGIEWKCLPGATFTQLDECACTRLAATATPAVPPLASSAAPLDTSDGAEPTAMAAGAFAQHTVMDLPDNPPVPGGGKSTEVHHFRLGTKTASRLNTDLLAAAVRMASRYASVCSFRSRHP
jgi:hypothetical protein